MFMEVAPGNDIQPKWHWKKMFQYFLQGLIILAPITITLWAVLSLFIYIDNILPNFFHTLFPGRLEVDSEGNPKKIPGMGFLIVVVIVIIVGWVSSSFIVSKIVDFLGHLLERTPGIKLIYSSVRDFLEAFAGNKRKFTKPVLVNVDGHDVWRVGFITQSDCEVLGMIEHLAVYVPHSYAISGIVYIVPVEKVKAIFNITSGEVMKFVVSGGITHIVDKNHVVH